MTTPVTPELFKCVIGKSDGHTISQLVTLPCQQRKHEIGRHRHSASFPSKAADIATKLGRATQLHLFRRFDDPRSREAKTGSASRLQFSPCWCSWCYLTTCISSSQLVSARVPNIRAGTRQIGVKTCEPRKEVRGEGLDLNRRPKLARLHEHTCSLAMCAMHIVTHSRLLAARQWARIDRSSLGVHPFNKSPER